jgi:hypothetical protein
MPGALRSRAPGYPDERSSLGIAALRGRGQKQQDRNYRSRAVCGRVAVPARKREMRQGGPNPSHSPEQQQEGGTPCAFRLPAAI